MFMLCTRWFKYDRDKLWLVYTQIVPVIFEPPCISKFMKNWSPLLVTNISKENMHCGVTGKIFSFLNKFLHPPPLALSSTADPQCAITIDLGSLFLCQVIAVWSVRFQGHHMDSQQNGFMGWGCQPYTHSPPWGPSLHIYICQRDGGPVIPLGHWVLILMAFYNVHGLWQHFLFPGSPHRIKDWNTCYVLFLS
jgi:hypothetical protein